MNLAIYCGSGAAALRQLESVINDMGSRHKVSVYRDLAELRRDLHRPGKRLALIILHANSRDDLEEMLLLKRVLQDIRIVLILPDLEAATVSMAHRLQPRFLTCADGYWGGLLTILDNMIRRYAEDSRVFPCVGDSRHASESSSGSGVKRPADRMTV